MEQFIASQNKVYNLNVKSDFLQPNQNGEEK